MPRRNVIINGGFGASSPANGNGNPQGSGSPRSGISQPVCARNAILSILPLARRGSVSTKRKWRGFL